MALAAGVAVGLAGGVVTGTAIDRSGVEATVSAARMSVTRTDEGLPGRGAFERVVGRVGAAAEVPSDGSLAMVDSGSEQVGSPSAADPAVPATVDPTAVDATGLTFADREAGLLSADVPQGLGGDLVVVPGNEPAPAPERGVRTGRVEVEAGLDVDGAMFARTVMATLNDARGWGADGSVTFARTDGDADFRVVLVSPDTVDDLCAPLSTVGEYSCGRSGAAVINYKRWATAAPDFADRTLYREYVINHEVGHLLGHGHLECPGAGEVAPIMQQQTVGVAPCIANGWPFPDAA